MRELIVCCALAIVLTTYVIYSLKDGSWFNLLTPQLFFAVPSMYIGQLARLSLGLDEPAGLGPWLFVFACYCLPVVVSAWALIHSPVPKVLRIRHRRRVRIQLSPWLFLLLAFLLYLPIAIEFRADLLNPREIYEQSRSGYGLNFFVSTMMANLGFVLYLFKTRSAARRSFFFAICTALALAHGSKGAVLMLGMLWLIHWRYVDGHKMSFARAVPLGMTATVLLLGLFYFFSRGIELDELGDYIIGYSDYTSNGLMVVSDDKPALFGRIFLEDNIYSRIPRALFPAKPKDFGSFYLAQMYFPESFELDQGAPAFGVGSTFADFKWLSLPILCLCSYALAVLTKAYQRSLAHFRHPADFIMLAFLCGVPLISVGVGFLLPEHLIAAGLVTLILRLSWNASGRKQPNGPLTSSPLPS